MPKSAFDIINGMSNMSTRPEYYSGRGPTTSDLNSKILDSIHAEVLKHNGQGAAKAFVNMVGDLKEMGATSFLHGFYHLDSNDWKFKKRDQHNDGIDVGPDDENGGRFITGMATIAGVLSRRDQTPADLEAGNYSVAGQFLNKHGHKRFKNKNPYMLGIFG